MWALIAKDLSLQIRSILSYLILAVLVGVFVMSFTRGGEGIIYLLGAMAVLNVSFRTAYEDDRNRGFAFLCSLPLQRATVVWSKFTGSLLITLASFSLIFLIDRVLAGFQPLDTCWEKILIYTLFPSGILLLLGIFWVLFFKFGYIRASSMIRFIFLVPLVAVPVALKLVPGGGATYLAGFLRAPFCAVFSGLALLFYALALAISLAIFQKAELG